jgi:hypothetical protein
MSKKDNEKEKPSGSYIGIGIALGVVFGLALDNLAIGIALGVVLGVGFDESNKRKDEKD